MNYSKDCNYFRCFYCVGLFPRFIFWFKRDIKKNWIFHIDFNDFHDLLLPYFSGCKNKKIKQKTNPAASKMKPFMTLVDDLFGKQLNNITKNPISDDPRSASLLSISKKPVWSIHLFRTYFSRVYGKLRRHALRSV